MTDGPEETGPTRLEGPAGAGVPPPPPGGEGGARKARDEGHLGTRDAGDEPRRGHAAYDSDLLGRRGFRVLLLAAFALFVLWLARGIIGPFIVAAVLAYAFSPVVNAVQERTPLPRAAIILVGYMLLFAGLAIFIYFVAHRAATEVRELSHNGPDILATALERLLGQQLQLFGQTVSTQALARQIHDAILGAVSKPTDAVHMAAQGVDLLLQSILCLIVTFYFLLDGGRFGQFLLRFLDRRRRVRAVHLADRIHVVLGRWLRGQLFLIALVAVVLYLLLGPWLGVPYSLTIAILSGVLEIIPLVGPLVAASIATIAAYADSGPNAAIIVIVVYAVLRQVEDQVVMPVVIGRAVHLHPVVTIFAVLLGLSLFGILGGLLGVPVAAALNVTLHELYPEETGPGPGEPAAGA